MCLFAGILIQQQFEQAPWGTANISGILFRGLRPGKHNPSGSFPERDLSCVGVFWLGPSNSKFCFQGCSKHTKPIFGSLTFKDLTPVFQSKFPSLKNFCRNLHDMMMKRKSGLIQRKRKRLLHSLYRWRTSLFPVLTILKNDSQKRNMLFHSLEIDFLARVPFAKTVRQLHCTLRRRFRKWSLMHVNCSGSCAFCAELFS